MKALKFWVGILIGWLIATSLWLKPAWAGEKYVNLVSLVRGRQNWLSQEDWLAKQVGLVNRHNWQTTWLIDENALEDEQIKAQLTKIRSEHEIGLLMEVTEQLANRLRLPYEKLRPSHEPENLFLSGYSISQRQKVIDYLMERFKQNWGEYPKSVGAWFIDSWSLKYLHDQYEVAAALLAAEQYGTDHHTIRGQPWQGPYYPAKNHVLLPAKSVADRIGVVVIQWAAREPNRGYGIGPERSNFSVQANDYSQQGLNETYFEKLLSTYLDNPWQELNQLTVGIEVGQEGAKYEQEFGKLLGVMNQRRAGISFVSMSQLAEIVKKKFPEAMENRLASWQNPEDETWAGWVTTSNYRVGLVANKEGVIIRDWRVYSSDQEDKSWGTDRQRELIRQAEGLIDQARLGNSWQLIQGQTGIPEINRLADEIELAWGGKRLKFDDQAMELNFAAEGENPNPTNLRIENIDGSWGVRQQAVQVSQSRSLSWWVVIAILAGLIFWRAGWAGLMAVGLVTFLSVELWILTPVNDLGLKYVLFKWPAILVYLVTPIIYGVIGVWVYRKVNQITGSKLLGLMSEVIFFGKMSLGWLLVLYRRLPLDSGLITGMKNNIYNFWWWIKFPNLARLEYAFSEGQMNIDFLAQRLWLGAGMFLLINLGVGIIGLVYLGIKYLTGKQWIKLVGLVSLMTVTMLGVNRVEVRLPILSDVTLEAVAVIGLTGWLWQVTQKRQKLVGLILGIVLMTILPNLISINKRNQELMPRLNQKWADKGKIKTLLKQADVSDIFLEQIKQSKRELIYIPTGINQYFFLQLPEQIKLVTENSYATIGQF